MQAQFKTGRQTKVFVIFHPNEAKLGEKVFATDEH